MSATNSVTRHGTAGVGRSARLDRVLAELVGQVPEIEAASVVSFDGLAMASALPPGMDEDRVAAMSAALLSLGERAAEGLGRGELSQVYVEGENGTVFLVAADDEAVLVAVAAKGAKVGLMLFEVRRAAAALAVALGSLPTELAWPVHDVAVEPDAGDEPAQNLPGEPAEALVDQSAEDLTDRSAEDLTGDPVEHLAEPAALVPLHVVGPVVGQSGWPTVGQQGSLAPNGASVATDAPSWG